MTHSVLNLERTLRVTMTVRVKGMDPGPAFERIQRLIEAGGFEVDEGSSRSLRPAGRPRAPVAKVASIRRMHAAGNSIQDIARTQAVSTRTVYRIVAAHMDKG